MNGESVTRYNRITSTKGTLPTRIHIGNRRSSIPSTRTPLLMHTMGRADRIEQPIPVLLLIHRIVRTRGHHDVIRSARTWGWQLRAIQSKDLTHRTLEPPTPHRIAQTATDREPEPMRTQRVGAKVHRDRPAALAQLGLEHRREIATAQPVPTAEHRAAGLLVVLAGGGVHAQRIGTRRYGRRKRAGLRGTSQPGCRVAGHPPRRRLGSGRFSLPAHTRPSCCPRLWSRRKPAHTRRTNREHIRPLASHTRGDRLTQNQTRC